jgi:hypothetical protein
MGVAERNVSEFAFRDGKSGSCGHFFLATGAEWLRRSVERGCHVEKPYELNESMKEIAKDATAAALVHVVERLKMHPAEQKGLTEFLAAVIRGAVECGILLDRGKRLTPSKN